MQKRILFASDLDNTLIRSYKHKIDGDICVEYIDGNPQSYMSPYAIELLRELHNNLWFVPVTTRSVAQYKRIRLGVEPQYAFTDNGGTLLINGVCCDYWGKRIAGIMADSRYYCEYALSLFSRFQECSKQRIVDDIFAFCISSAPEKTMKNLVASGIANMNIVHQGRKVYAIPSSITKGEALIHMKTILEADIVVCAGDSALDIDMLNQADVAIVPVDMAGSITASTIRVHNGYHPFESFVLNCVRDIF